MNKEKAALLSIVSNSTLVIFKFIAAISIGSISVMSEAIHSSMDLLASFIAFISIKKAAAAEDEEHPFGHGKYENVSGFVEALLILFAAILIIYEALKKVIYSSSIENVGPGLLVMFVSAFVNFIISTVLMKISKKTNSIALEADALHLLTDVATALGVFFGLILVKITGLSIIDPIAAILVACLIIKTSIDLIKKSLNDLVDSKLSDEDIEKIVRIVSSHRDITGYHRLRTRKCGENKQIDIHLIINRNFSLIEAHDLCDTVESEIKVSLPKSYVLIHAEPSYK
ncbi:cation transporter [Clostridium carboxidivorans P7]|uniref:Cation diffusion facilitator family transporter n=1 Tax=Clostridium carboxidivorans P7 TaxID=536227 RepID=C6PVS2_9CLOT|nr:cation diffusion facilitator family transporter [Clostridium carboxidivorans]AKN30624.1 cation transporter [Clostridium carboxidivorans P7]EET86696.1 cation diffusion facilitator family transporter [Clostridium carboxidivorans P7]EFG86377.1 cation diffusion facilitator family transporter [Clostridium carboxidivorans P7]